MQTPFDELDTPALLIDLDILDANLQRMRQRFEHRDLDIRIHFKSLKCGGLAKYLQSKGMGKFLCAKLNEAEVLADAGIDDIFIANQVVSERKLQRLCDLAKRVYLRVCVDDAANIEAMNRVAVDNGVTLNALIEVDVGMRRCGVEAGEPVLKLAKLIARSPGLQFIGLQGYDGHIQPTVDSDEKWQKCQSSIQMLMDSKRLLEENGIEVSVITGGGTSTSPVVGNHEGMTEIQPGSFLLMDAFYHTLRPEFACSLSILCTVISRRPEWYVLDAGSKAISQDFGAPKIKQRDQDSVNKLAEEHTRVETEDQSLKIGDRVEVHPAHCCATMNLHRQAVAVRQGKIESIWPIEASGRYD